MQASGSIRSTPRSNECLEKAPVDFRFCHPPTEQLFIALRDAYSGSGSIAWADDLSRLMADLSPELPATHLARLMRSDEVFHFQWRGSRWIPMVQFHLDDLSINRQVQQVRRELDDHLDGWETAS